MKLERICEQIAYDLFDVGDKVEFMTGGDYYPDTLVGKVFSVIQKSKGNINTIRIVSNDQFCWWWAKRFRKVQ